MFQLSLPTKQDRVPTGPDWLHEVKYDGYRLQVIREGDRMRLITKGGAVIRSGSRGLSRSRASSGRPGS
jgi:ATP-dependent DNA ligase